MRYSLVQMIATVAFGCGSVRGFERVTLSFNPTPPLAPDGREAVYRVGFHRLAPGWLDRIPKYVCDHPEVSLELTEPSKFGPRWLFVEVANYGGGSAEGSCLIDTSRGPRIISYSLVPQGL